MSKISKEAKAWLRDNDPHRRFRSKKYLRQVKRRRGHIPSDCCDIDSVSLDRKRAAEEPIEKNGKHQKPPSFMEFIRQNCSFEGAECLLMPFARSTDPRKVRFRGAMVSCSRAMCILAHGAPPDQDDQARHLCGNGHLSCVNPNHLAWGSASDNKADAVVHATMPDATPAERVAAARLAESLRSRS